MPSSSTWQTPKSDSCQHQRASGVTLVVGEPALWDDEPMKHDEVQVLIVDDQLPFREASRMVVEMTDGFDVAGEAVNGDQALEMIARLQPDLVLMDVQMPGIDGIETTRRIRSLADPPVVLVMSTHESGDYEKVALEAGAVGFVPKSQFGMETLAEIWDLASRG